jgi:RNA polymerase sigma factor (sigma-70 family)
MTANKPEALLQHIRDQVGPGVDALSDRDLLERFARGGDEAAFAALVRRYGAMVLRICRNILDNHHDADDVFQATFLVLARKAGALGWRESVAGWIQEAAFRLARKARTTALRRRCHEARAQPRQQTGSPLAEITLREAQAVLDEELARLSDKYRGPLVLCYLQGATQEEAACQLGWSLNTFKRRLYQARELLHARLERRGLGLGAALAATLLTRIEAPAALVGATIEAGLLFRAGQPVGAGRGGALAEAALEAVSLARQKTTVLVVLAAVVLAAGLCLGAYRAFPERPPEPATTQVPPALASPSTLDRKDNLGDPLPEKALARMGTTRLRLAGPAEAVAFSASGRMVISCGGLWDCTLRVWDTDTGKELWRRKLKQPLQAVAVSRDGRLVAAGGDDGLVRLHELATGNEVRLLRGHQDRISSLLFTPDGKTVISGSWDGTVRLWDSATGQQRQRLDMPGYLVRSLALSRDGKVLAAGYGESVGLEFREESGRMRLVRNAPTPRLSSGLALPNVLPAPDDPRDDPRSRQFAWSNPIRLWDLPAGRERPRLRGNRTPVTSLAFSHDGKTLASGSGTNCPPLSNPVLLWDVATGKELRTFDPSDWADALHRARTGIMGHVVSRRRLLALAFSPDDRALACGCCDGNVYLVDPVAGIARGVLEARGLPRSFDPSLVEFWALRGGLLSLAYAPNGQTLVTGADDYAVRLWNVSTQREKPTAGHGGPVTSVTFSPDGQTLATAGVGPTVRLWDVRTAQQRVILRDRVDSLVYTWSGEFQRGPIEAAKWSTVDSPVVTFSPNGKLLAATRGQAALLWDLSSPATPRWRIKWQRRQTPVFSANSKTLLLVKPRSREGRWISASTGVPVASVPAGDDSGPVPGDPPLVTPDAGGGQKEGGGLAVSGGGQLLAWWAPSRGPAAPATGRIQRASGGKQLCQFGQDLKSITVLAFSPDGKVLAGAAGWPRLPRKERPLVLWDSATGRELQRFAGHEQGHIYALAVAPGNQLLASAGEDRTVRLWDVKTAEQVACFKGHQAVVSCLAFSPDGKKLASGSDDGTALVWDATTRSGSRHTTP